MSNCIDVTWIAVAGVGLISFAVGMFFGGALLEAKMAELKSLAPKKPHREPDYSDYDRSGEG